MKLEFIEAIEAASAQLEIVADLAKSEGASVIAGRAAGLGAYMGGYARQGRILLAELDDGQLTLIDAAVGRVHDHDAA